MSRNRIIAALALLALSCGGTHEYRNNDLELAVNHAARDVCSCLFVMELDEAGCAAWVRARPEVASFRVDRQRKVVEASAFLLWGARARYDGPRYGCVLE